MATIILPSLIDPHVHLRDPGQTEKEDFYTGTSAALTGGYTTILDMPNNKKSITTSEALDEKIQTAKDKIVCDVGFYFGSTGDNLGEFEKIQGKTFGLKLYLNKTTGNYLINRDKLTEVFEAWTTKSPILLHAIDETIDDVIQVLKTHPRPIHICHISSEHELSKVIEAKEQRLPITCGVTPHHLFLTENDLNHLSGFGLMQPPLRRRSDVDFLWKNLKAIDCIESDHAPHTIDEKQSDNPPYGVPGLETTLPLFLTAVSEGKLRMEDIIRLCHGGPKQIFFKYFDYSNNRSNVEIDLDAKYEINNKNLLTKCKWSPFDGWKVKGKITNVTIRGIHVYDGQRILVDPGFGKIITPS